MFETDYDEVVNQVAYLEAQLERTEVSSRLWGRIGGVVTAANISLDIYTIRGMMSGYEATDAGYFLIASSAVIAFASFVSAILQDTRAQHVQEELEELYDQEIWAANYPPTTGMLEPVDPNPNYNW